MPEAEASVEEPRSRSARSVPEEPRKTIAELSAEMLRDFPITGNEGATIADGYTQNGATIFVNKGHGLKELDLIAKEGEEYSKSYILHIDTSREGVDIIQCSEDFTADFSAGDKVKLLNRGNATISDEISECSYRNMKGERVEVKSPHRALGKGASVPYTRAYMHTEAVKMESTDIFANTDRIEVYRGHGLLPGDVVFTESSSSPSTRNILDIINNDMYDEVVLDTPNDGYGGANIYLFNRLDDSSLSSDLLAKRNAYISKMQAS